MAIPVGIARKIIRISFKKDANGEKVNIAAIMKSIDALGDGDGTVPRPAGYIQDLLRRAVHYFLQRTPAPPFVHIQGHQVVQSVVRRRNVVEHLLYFFFPRHQGTGS